MDLTVPETQCHETGTRIMRKKLSPKWVTWSCQYQNDEKMKLEHTMLLLIFCISLFFHILRFSKHVTTFLQPSYMLFPYYCNIFLTIVAVFDMTECSCKCIEESEFNRLIHAYIYILYLFNTSKQIFLKY